MMKNIIKTLLVVGSIALSVNRASALEQDLRASKLDAYLASHNSPLEGLGETFVAIADSYNLDWTILPAISGTESTFAKRMPANCNNPFGWGIYGSNRICFESLAEAILAVGEGIGTKYNTKSIRTIGHTYNKVSTEHWIANTTFFMNKIKNFDVPVSALPIEF